MFRLAVILLIVALFASPALAQFPVSPVQPYGVGVGFGYSPYYGYRYSYSRVPLPTYNGAANYILPQTQYQFYGTPYGATYQYQSPPIFQGNAGFYVPGY